MGKEEDLKPIEFNFVVPSDYRREFRLKYLGGEHRIVVDQAGVERAGGQAVQGLDLGLFGS